MSFMKEIFKKNRERGNESIIQEEELGFSDDPIISRQEVGWEGLLEEPVLTFQGVNGMALSKFQQCEIY